jgi:hypothetical protein
MAVEMKAQLDQPHCCCCPCRCLSLQLGLTHLLLAQLLRQSASTTRNLSLQQPVVLLLLLLHRPNCSSCCLAPCF